MVNECVVKKRWEVLGREFTNDRLKDWVLSRRAQNTQSPRNFEPSAVINTNARYLAKLEVKIADLRDEEIAALCEWEGLEGNTLLARVRALVNNSARAGMRPAAPSLKRELVDKGFALDLRTIKAILTRRNKLPDTHTVCYIIAPSTGGANHVDNYCVLPKALALPAHTSAGYNLLMAKLLPKTKITKAVTVALAKPAGTAYDGPSADSLDADADTAFKAEHAFPWGGSRSGGGAAAGGAAANGAQENGAQEDDSQGADGPEEQQAGAAAAASDSQPSQPGASATDNDADMSTESGNVPEPAGGRSTWLGWLGW